LNSKLRINEAVFAVYFACIRRTPLAAKGTSDTSIVKAEIQRVLRDIVIKRVGGCILTHTGNCDGYAKDGHLILQADHHEREYNALVRTLLSPERVQLWDACERDSWRPHRKYTMDWRIELASLKQELARMQ
jgi:hypothetical protein